MPFISNVLLNKIQHAIANRCYDENSLSLLFLIVTIWRSLLSWGIVYFPFLFLDIWWQYFFAANIERTTVAKTVTVIKTMEVILRLWIQHFVSEVSVPFPCTRESFVVFCSTLESLVDSTLSLGFPLSWSWQSDLPNVRISPHRDRLIFPDLARKTQVSNMPTIVKNHLMIMLMKNFLPNKGKSFKIPAWYTLNSPS